VTEPTDPRKLVSEFLGTGFLVLGVVGSGIMAERLSDDVGLQLLENAIATAGILLALILALGPVSGAHFNPVVSIAEWANHTLSSSALVAFIASQFLGGIAGAMGANYLFGLAPINVSTKDRSGFEMIPSEMLATFGLMLVIYGVVTAGRPTLAALTVAGYIGAAYWFTPSTSFANPAVTVARTLSNTFAGIDPTYAIRFVIAQLAGAAIAIPLLRWLFANNSPTMDQS
jgi:arsenate reductase